ncbi:unnamed protein product [Prorocentrum cordatum]|uniref:Uncharacterized protein n=1 Tax=Prorocentrum cordatum TaxID=2364126 RepID=A0ABN9SQ24_9DINO|nr:unnamed protein product [Polarella glacialis]
MPRALAAASTRRRTGACHERGECSRLPTCSGGRSSHAHADTRARRIFGVAPSMPRPSTGPRGSVRAARWLPQQRVGKPSLDIFVVETPSQKPEDGPAWQRLASWRAFGPWPSEPAACGCRSVPPPT